VAFSAPKSEEVPNELDGRALGPLTIEVGATLGAATSAGDYGG